MTKMQQIHKVIIYIIFQSHSKEVAYGNDEVPIGGKSKFQIDEFPPEGSFSGNL